MNRTFPPELNGTTMELNGIKLEFLADFGLTLIFLKCFEKEFFIL